MTGTTTYTLSTGTGEGTCVVIDLGFGKGAEVMCSDGGSSAVGNTLYGCTSRTGSGSCVLGPTTLDTGDFTVQCPGESGETFELNTNSGEGSCNTELKNEKVVGGKCDDGKGNNVTVDCTVNDGAGSCLSQTGKGSCICTSCGKE